MQGKNKLLIKSIIGGILVKDSIISRQNREYQGNTCQDNCKSYTSIPLSDKQRNLRKVKIVQQFIVAIMFSLLILIEVVGIRPQCPVHSIFENYYCPFCGLTRLFEQLLAFDIVQAFRWNPFMFVQLILSPVAIYFLIKDYVKQGKINIRFKIIFVCWLFMAIAFMILRNTQTFSYLLPTKIR